MTAASQIICNSRGSFRHCQRSASIHGSQPVRFETWIATGLKALGMTEAGFGVKIAWFCGVLPIVAGLPAGALAQEPQPASVFAVANVQARAAADNAVMAKTLAIASAEAKALRILIGRIADFRTAARIPEVTPEEVAPLVSNIEVQNEGVSATSYVATFAVTFSERGVRGLFARYGAVPIDGRGPAILIVPVYVENGAAQTASGNPWRKALGQLDLNHALVPAKLAPVRNDITASIAAAYIANPAAAAETLKSQYRVSQVLLAMAEIEAGGSAISVRLAGADALGTFGVARRLKAGDGADNASMEDAAAFAFATVQERWKLTRESGGASGPAATAQGADGGAAGSMARVEIIAQYSGLKEWQTIRTRLQKLPGVQNWDLKSVDPRNASITFDFPGGAERFAEAAPSQGLSVESGPQGAIVRTR